MPSEDRWFAAFLFFALALGVAVCLIMQLR
jgi:hypothetical protein